MAEVAEFLPVDQIICGDCNDVLATFPADSIDFILTDPPYARKFLYTYQYLADHTPRQDE
jgi:DNA modification methylase